MGLCDFDPIFELLSLSKIVSTASQANKLKNPFLHITLHGSSVCMRASFHLHVIHDERLIVRSLSVSSCLSFSCFSLLFTSSLLYPTCFLTSTPSLRLGSMRSIAHWRYTILPQFSSTAIFWVFQAPRSHELDHGD